MQGKEELIVNGFQFKNKKDADEARNEVEKIRLLESRMDYEQVEQVNSIYEKAIQNRVFKTPVGYMYLHSLQEFLLDNPIEGKEVRSIPLFLNYMTAFSKDNQERIAHRRIEPKVQPKEPVEVRLKRMQLLSIVLVLAVIAMFVIALRGETPNILNYKTAIVNEYASWEQELSEREQKVKEKEQQLKMEGEAVQNQKEEDKSE